MYTKGLVSVIIPTYKRSEKLSRAIKSTLEQTYLNIEVLVVSDNEPDDEFSIEAGKVVDSFHDARVKLILQEHHKNGAAARNVGLRAAKGEYIALLDDDDYWEKQKIELQVQVLSALDESWGAVTCKNKSLVNGKVKSALPKIRDGWICKDILTRITDVSTDAILMRHTAVDDAGYFDERLKRHQEVQLMAFFTQKYKVKLLDMYLVCVDSTKNENQPNPEQMAEIKAQFLDIVSPVTFSMSLGDRKDIYIMNEFELGILYFRTGRKVYGFKKCLKVFTSVRTLFYACKYMAKKINSRVFAKYRVKHDQYYKMAPNDVKPSL